MLFLNTFEASLCLMQVSLCPRDQPIPWGMLLHFLRFWSSFVQAEICEDYPKWLPWQPCPNCWTFRRGKTAQRSTEEWPHTDGDCFELQREVKKCTENHGKPSSKPPSKQGYFIYFYILPLLVQLGMVYYWLLGLPCIMWHRPKHQTNWSWGVIDLL